MSKVISRSETQNKSSLNHWLIAACAILMTVQSVGCASATRLGVGEAVAVGYRDYVWAKRAYNLRFGNCNRAYAEHFESGFCAGYTEMCNGGDGFTPALPPSEYRGYEFQSADAVQCVNSWFEGYPEGVAAAKKDNAGTYHDILISRMINTATKHENAKASLPSQVPIVSAGYERTGVPIVQPQQRRPLPPVVTPTSLGLPPIIDKSVPGFIPQASNESSDSKEDAVVATEYYAQPLPLEKEQGMVLPLANSNTEQ